MSCCPRCALQRELRRVGDSPLLAEGGLRVYDGLLDSPTLRALQAEAATGAARLDRHAAADTEDVRGGTPPRRLISVAGGAAQQALFSSPALVRFLAAEVRYPVRPLGVRGTYSIYTGPDAHLGLHRDVEGCDLALIVCLRDTAPRPDRGAMEIWPDDYTTPLGELRSTRRSAPRTVELLPGQAMLLHGGIVPHRIQPVGAGRERIVAIMCFEIRSGGSG